jgi:hypothetical protein
LVENTGSFEKAKYLVELREGEISGGDGNAFAIGQLGAVSLDEFLKLLEFSNRRPGSRSES